MFSTLLAITLSASPVQDTNRATSADRATDRAGNTSLDGNWTIVSLEKDGQPVQEAKQMTVMIKDNTITCSGKDGKAAMTWKVDFANKGMLHVRSTDAQSGSQNTQGQNNQNTPNNQTNNNQATGNQANSSDVKSGVYVLTSNVLAICVHDPKADLNSTSNASGTGTTTNTGTSAVGVPQSKSHCSIILMREGASSSPGTTPNR